jgi:hypothetical protein
MPNQDQQSGDVSNVLYRPDNTWYRENMRKSMGTQEGVAGHQKDSGDGNADNPALNIGPLAPITVLKPPFYTATGGHFDSATGVGYADQPNAADEMEEDEGL